MKKEWFDYLDAAITVCDKDGNISYMNKRSAEVFSKDGGYNLQGKSLFDCHNERSSGILREMLKKQTENTYTIEKEGVKKIIIQKPVYENGEFGGIIEFSFELPRHMPHHLRE